MVMYAGGSGRGARLATSNDAVKELLVCMLPGDGGAADATGSATQIVRFAL